MDFSRATQSASGLIGGIKDRFSRSGKGNDAQGATPLNDEGDYGEYGMDYAEENVSIEGDYGPYAYGEPEGSEYGGCDDYGYGERPRHGRSSGGSYSRGVRMPALVTSDDVRATTSVRGVDVNRGRVAATNAAVAREYLGHGGRGAFEDAAQANGYPEYGAYDEKERQNYSKAGSKMARPTRTMVEPKGTATGQSSVIPIESSDR